MVFASTARADEPAPDAALKSGFAQICASLAGDRILAVEMVVRVPRAGGTFDRYPIYLRGTEAVDEAVKRLALATPGRRGDAPKDAKKLAEYVEALDCRLVFQRDPNIVELEKRGDLLLELLAEDDAKPAAPPTPRLPAAALVMMSVEPKRIEILGFADHGLHRATIDAAKLRELLVAAVDEDAKRAADYWGDSLPYGMARSSLAEGIAYERLGCLPQARACFNRCIELCRKHGKWDYLEKDAAARLGRLPRADAAR